MASDLVVKSGGSASHPPYGHMQSAPGGIDLYALEQMKKKELEQRKELIAQIKGEESPITSVIDSLGGIAIGLGAILFIIFIFGVLTGRSGTGILDGFQTVFRVLGFATRTITSLVRWIFMNITLFIILITAAAAILVAIQIFI